MQEDLHQEARAGGEVEEARSRRQTEIEGMAQEMREVFPQEVGGRVPRKALEMGGVREREGLGEREGPREGERPVRKKGREQQTPDVVKGDLNQRKLFSDIQRQGGFFDQNSIAEKKNALMNKLRDRQRAPGASVYSNNNSPYTPIKLFSHEQTSRGQRIVRGPASNVNGFPLARDFEVDLGDFDPEAYLAGQQLKEGEDEMKRFQFNQRRSDGTPYDRNLKDVRNPRYVSYTGLTS